MQAPAKSSVPNDPSIRAPQPQFPAVCNGATGTTALIPGTPRYDGATVCAAGIHCTHKDKPFVSSKHKQHKCTKCHLYLHGFPTCSNGIEHPLDPNIITCRMCDPPKEDSGPPKPDARTGDLSFLNVPSPNPFNQFIRSSSNTKPRPKRKSPPKKIVDDDKFDFDKFNQQRLAHTQFHYDASDEEALSEDEFLSDVESVLEAKRGRSVLGNDDRLKAKHHGGPGTSWIHTRTNKTLGNYKFVLPKYMDDCNKKHWIKTPSKWSYQYLALAIKRFLKIGKIEDYEVYLVRNFQAPKITYVCAYCRWRFSGNPAQHRPVCYLVARNKWNYDHLEYDKDTKQHKLIHRPYKPRSWRKGGVSEVFPPVKLDVQDQMQEAKEANNLVLLHTLWSSWYETQSGIVPPYAHPKGADPNAFSYDARTNNYRQGRKSRRF